MVRMGMVGGLRKRRRGRWPRPSGATPAVRLGSGAFRNFCDDCAFHMIAVSLALPPRATIGQQAGVCSPWRQFAL
eukprot:1544185-Prymnesium_polylepis.1